MSETRQGRARLVIGRQKLRAPRRCMCCNEPFTSYGVHNRLCSRCKTQESDFSFLGLDTTRR
ncbi:hypothetical protein [Minwuia sp.]|uniref:hypothetical protein n=1 Tax=Minwuia sp. TaxID=2493630 RepID=UPI003A90A34C